MQTCFICLNCICQGQNIDNQIIAKKEGSHFGWNTTFLSCQELLATDNWPNGILNNNFSLSLNSSHFLNRVGWGGGLFKKHHNVGSGVQPFQPQDQTHYLKKATINTLGQILRQAKGRRNHPQVPCWEFPQQAWSQHTHFLYILLHSL